MPNTRIPVRAPLGIPTDIPPQQWIAGTALPGNPSRLEFGEMGLEEADLVFSVDGRRVGSVVHDAEMIPHCAFVDCCSCLGDELGSTHGLAIPEGGAVQSELGALGATCIGGVLVRWREVDVGIYGSGSMDVVLVWTNLIGP